MSHLNHNEHRQEKVESLLARQVGMFLSQEAGPMSLITVTHVNYNQKTNKAIIFLSVLPDSQEKTALAFAKRKSSDMREWMKEKVVMGNLPVFEFMIDIGEKNRQRVEEIAAQDAHGTDITDTAI